MLNTLQRGLPNPSFPSTAPPAQSSTLPILTPPTANIETPPEVATVADTAPTVDHYSGPTDSVAESSRKPNSLYPASPHSTVRQKGGMYNNQDYTRKPHSLYQSNVKCFYMSHGSHISRVIKNLSFNPFSGCLMKASLYKQNTVRQQK